MRSHGREGCLPALAPPLLNQRGATLLMVLVLVVILGLGAGMAGTTWKTVMQRVKEEELLFRGDQYRRAIESYTKYTHGNQGQQQNPQSPFGRGPGAVNYPSDLRDLLKDNRSLATVRHLRKLYKDPMTGEDFELIKEGGRIKGVRSTSKEEPFKQDSFPPAYVNFKGAQAYRDWEFVFEPGRNRSMNSTGGLNVQGLPGSSPSGFPPSPPSRSDGNPFNN